MSAHNFFAKMRQAAGTATEQVLNVPGQGYMLGWGTTVGNGVQAWSKGALFLDTDASTGAQFWINVGTSATASWKAISSLDADMTLAGAVNFTGTLLIGGVTVNATAAEINKATDVSARIVNTTATTLSVTATQHGGRVVTINSAAPIAITMPAASGSGEIYTFIIGTVATATAHTLKVANTSDKMQGVSIIAQTDTAQVNGFITTATDDTITLNGTTQGGLVGDRIILVDITTNVFAVKIEGGASGTVVTPFSATV